MQIKCREPKDAAAENQGNGSVSSSEEDLCFWLLPTLIIWVLIFFDEVILK